MTSRESRLRPSSGNRSRRRRAENSDGIADGHASTKVAIIRANGERPLDSALLQLARAVSLVALGDDDGKIRAIGNADAAASNVTAENLRAQFAVERAKVASAL